MKKIYINMAIILMIDSLSVYSQIFEPRNNIYLRVKAKVDQQIDNLMKYNYSINSLHESEQNVWNFSVIIKFHPDSLLKKFYVNGWWYPQCPDDDTLSWVSWCAPDDKEILPGDSLQGFGFITHYLPGISDFYAEGYTPPPYFENDDEGDDPIPGYDDLTPYGPGIVGKTVGPVIRPNSLNSTDFCDTLNSYINQSEKLGWVISQTVVEKYENLFNKAKIKYQQSNTDSVRFYLQKILENAKADSGINITSEAYFIIQYNTEYLIGQLPEKIYK
jgi:hypothetical protein